MLVVVETRVKPGEKLVDVDVMVRFRIVIASSRSSVRQWRRGKCRECQSLRRRYEPFSRMPGHAGTSAFEQEVCIAKWRDRRRWPGSIPAVASCGPRQRREPAAFSTRRPAESVGILRSATRCRVPAGCGTGGTAGTDLGRAAALDGYRWWPKAEEAFTAEQGGGQRAGSSRATNGGWLSTRRTARCAALAISARASRARRRWRAAAS